MSTTGPSGGRRATSAVAVAVVAVAVVLGLTGCSDDDGGAAPATTEAPATSTDPVCVALAELGEAWDVQASGPELGDPDALAAVAERQRRAIAGAVEDALATGAVPDEVAGDLAAVGAAGVAFVDDALAWANGDAPGVAPTLVPGTTEAQRRVDAWALGACGVEVWP